MENNKPITSVQTNTQADAKHVSNFPEDVVAKRRINMQRMRNAISISFVQSNKKFDQLDPSFMYTQILKEILLTIDFEDKHFKEFITYYREAVAKNDIDLSKIKEFERGYYDKIPIRWYTSECFLYSMLNQALRLMDVDIILRMGFFISDLHHDIQRLHSKQLDSQQSSKTSTVYRGQCLSKEDFTEMTKTKGGLLSFNNFLSTSTNRDVSLFFAPQDATNPDLIGILFVISINSTDLTTPFASLTDVSHFDDEDEVLFSMHTIFRIGDIKPTEENNHIYEVNLTLINDNDQDLRILTDHIRQETFPDSEGWYRLGLLLNKMGQFNKAQEVYEILRDQTTDENDKEHIYHLLGITKDSQGEHQEALTYFEKSLAIQQKTLSSNHPDFAISYNSIGLVYRKMGDYPKALSYHKKNLAILQKSVSSNHPDLGVSYNNIGSVYKRMGDYPKALSSHEKALAIRQQSLPSNHPDLASSFHNIGALYKQKGDYPKALSYYEKAIAIEQQSLPSNHPALGTSYNNVGNVYNAMGDHTKALSSHKKALVIRQQSLSYNHPDLGDSYNNIGVVYYDMGDYPEALSNYEKAIAIREQSLPSNHPDLGDSYSNIGTVCQNMDDYPKALSYFEKALVIRQQSLPSNHTHLGDIYNDIGIVYYGMDDCPKALSYYEKAIAVRQQSLPSNHPDLAISYNGIGSVYNSMDDYPKALSFHEKALAIRQQSLPSNHPDLGMTYNNIGIVYENMRNYLKAGPSYERAVQIVQQSLPKNHPNRRLYRKNLKRLLKKL
ncbi:unnamed protein product [Adineta steineri]|uniref:NAD(P)(+)--arginine ADP-ribosyltransferase n=1 Tax=Adineta steineri TaxID=433720 RepID=A0A814TYU3_9BILA|nr:unnamed protein product [Adineta steineri]CAF3717544.1 unnamed protein product [Adineta steineri]